MTSPTIPAKLNLKKDEKLEVVWQDNTISNFSLSYLRSMCPCAQCKEQREGKGRKINPLRILPGNYVKPLAVQSAELVGNYALKIRWSDGHDTGLYTWGHLRRLCEQRSES